MLDEHVRLDGSGQHELTDGNALFRSRFKCLQTLPHGTFDETFDEMFDEIFDATFGGAVARTFDGTFGGTFTRTFDGTFTS